MIETQLNIFDAIVICIMLMSCLFAFFRGFVREVLSLGAWIGAGFVTLYYFPQVAERLQPHFKTPFAAAGVATLSLYIGSLMGFSIINRILLKFIKSGSDVGMLDNLFGLCFGAFRGAFILSLGYFLISMALNKTEHPEWLKTAKTRPYVEQGAAMLVSLAPEYVKDIADFQQKAQDKIQPSDMEEVHQELRRSMEDASEDDRSNEGYSPESRAQLERMLRSLKDQSGEENAEE